MFVLGQRLIVSFVYNDFIDSSQLSFASRKDGFSFIKKKAIVQPLITILPSKEPGLFSTLDTNERLCEKSLPLRLGRAGRCRLILKDLSPWCGP